MRQNCPIHKMLRHYQLFNDRGIFVVCVLRMILDSLIYQDKFNDVDENMSNSNIGSRKNRNIRDHLFVVYGILNSVLNGEADPIDVQIYDVEKCFDALWLEDCMLDMYETIPPHARDDKLALIYEMNKENYVAVKTSVGLTERVMLPSIVMQGGKWGPLKCSNTMDKIGKKCMEKGEHLYTYKGQVKVMPLAMVDDLLGIARCGDKSLDLNTVINSKIEMKKLKFHTPDANGKSKCHTMHVGKCASGCPSLKVHGSQMERVSSDTYLGDIVSDDGKNKLNIESRVAKGLGITSQIMDILKCVSFGSHFFEIAATLRESFLVNGILTNCEVWYGLTDGEVSQLEEVDRLLLRQVFRVPSSCPVEALYLESGCVPLRYVIKNRKINYLHHLVTRSEREMIYQFLMAQWKFPAKKNEWTEQVKADLLEFSLDDELNWIKKKSKSSFKILVKNQMREVALVNLLEKKESHSKMMSVNYSSLMMQAYLKDPEVTATQAQTMFKFKTRMEKFSENFKGGRPTKPCPLCKASPDTQAHSFQCKVIQENIVINGTLLDVFSQSNNKPVAETLENIVKFRENYLEE